MSPSCSAASARKKRGAGAAGSSVVGRLEGGARLGRDDAARAASDRLAETGLPRSGRAEQIDGVAIGALGVGGAADLQIDRRDDVPAAPVVGAPREMLFDARDKHLHTLRRARLREPRGERLPGQIRCTEPEIDGERKSRNADDAQGAR